MKQKTLFDHIKQITSKSNTNYYNNLSEEDKKTYSVYMIHRFLSMNSDWTEIVNEIQKYSQQLKNSGIHRIYDEIIPKSKIFLTYIKASKEKKYNQDVLNILKKYYELGELQVKEYYDIFIKTDEGKRQLLDIVKMYGVQEKEYKKIEKGINGKSVGGL